MKRLYVVGLGPGGTDYLTPQARKALEDCEVLCGSPPIWILRRTLPPGKNWSPPP